VIGSDVTATVDRAADELPVERPRIDDRPGVVHGA
jgi:hypothetical protein